jgi:hypothetical protein
LTYILSNYNKKWGIRKLFSKRPKSYYGIFSFVFKSKLYWLFIIYIFGVLLITYTFSLFYNIAYAGLDEVSIQCVNWFQKWYYSLITFISPGFTEFLPLDDTSRLITSINGLVGISFNALFISLLIARALQPHEPFEVVPFLLYDPEKKTLTTRIYSTLPSNCYNISFKLFRFLIAENDHKKQMGYTREIKILPEDRNVLMPNYGLLLRTEVDVEENPHHSSVKKDYRRKKIPISWLIPEHDKYLDGHFYILLEAETVYGKMFQKFDFYTTKKNIKVGRHTLLNEGYNLNLSNWYDWKKYRWDLWGKFNKIPDNGNYDNDLIFNRYK